MPSLRFFQGPSSLTKDVGSYGHFTNCPCEHWEVTHTLEPNWQRTSEARIHKTPPKILSKIQTSLCPPKVPTITSLNFEKKPGIWKFGLLAKARPSFCFEPPNCEEFARRVEKGFEPCRAHTSMAEPNHGCHRRKTGRQRHAS